MIIAPGEEKAAAREPTSAIVRCAEWGGLAACGGLLINPGLTPILFT
jgi:hypothetical protein